VLDGDAVPLGYEDQLLGQLPGAADIEAFGGAYDRAALAGLGQ
jgi:hypothetical protein